jgi:hypothetical protein
MLKIRILIEKLKKVLFLKKEYLKMYLAKYRNRDIRDIRSIRQLVLILFTVIVISLLVDSLTDISTKYFGRNNNKVSTVVWEINIPDNYSIKEKGSYVNEYFGVYYEEWSGNYKVTIYTGKEYTLPQIKGFINSKLLEFKDFEDYSYLEKHKIIFTDRRTDNLPSMDIPDEIND